MTCLVCSTAIEEGLSNCPACGASQDEEFAETRINIESNSEDSATRIQPDAPRPISKRQSNLRKTPSSSVTLIPAITAQSEIRFAIGAIVADRYRILGQLGKGGMGEVYRAEDLKLGQPVALKFLPEELANDGGMLARFHREVRIARQVSHPNVCRVFDIGEVDGQHFLSMEYIDGEDLATLMKRIGRLPHDKAVEISRQICAGLAAAHESDVLHRDLKPANIMLDGRGKARITDFGLAGLTGEIRGDDIRSGTPAYMAPEQLAGDDVSTKSDIYSLGLVLYEIFTGKRVYEASTLADLLLQHEKSTPVTPSSHVKEIDPLVEKIILRCLEKDPKKRPQSALQIATALPGGDPLAAALAAGETPSPEMLVAAAKEGALKPLVAVSLFGAILILIAAILFLSSKTYLHNYVPMEKSADVLADRANSIAKKFGYTYTPADTEFGFESNYQYLTYVAKTDGSPSRWNRLASGQPSAITFSYRQSPRELIPYNGRFVTLNDPPVSITDMVNMGLDTKGRLLFLLAIPVQYDASLEKSPPVDWGALFAEADLDIANFKPTEPRWLPLVNSDTRLAWEGVFPNAPDLPLRIEAASYAGKPVYFTTLAEWDRPYRMEVFQPPASAKFFTLLVSIFITAILAGGLMLARRNLRLGRGDRKGALRLAAYISAVNFISWALEANHAYSLSEVDMLIPAVAFALMFGCLIWILYIALEPFVRRTHPERIIAWSRLLAGEWRDPLVGRDILIGAMVGITLALFNQLAWFAPRWFGKAPAVPISAYLNALTGFREMLGNVVAIQQGVILNPMGTLFFFVLLSLIFKREMLAMILFILFFVILAVLENGNLSFIRLPFIILSVVAGIVVLMRFGLLAMMATQLFRMLTVFPLTLDFSAWYAQASNLIVLVSIIIASYAFYTSLAGQKVFRENLFGD